MTAVGVNDGELTRNVTVAGLLSAAPSLALYWNVSTPVKPAAGV